MYHVLYDIAHLVSSLLFVVFLMEWLLLQLKRKIAFPLKLFQYYKRGTFIICCCFCYNLYYYFKMREYFDIIELGSILAMSVLFIFVRQMSGYSKAEINSCLQDSESIGAYWAQQAFDAYYKIVLEDIIERMLLFEKEYDVHFFIKKLIVVIPLSCNSENTLSERDDAVKDFGFLRPIENDQGANVNRIYKNPVFIILKDIYIVAELSSPMSALWKSRSHMEKETRDYIRDCYIKRLKFLVEGSPCIVVEYDDNGEFPKTLHECILSSIKKENNYVI